MSRYRRVKVAFSEERSGCLVEGRDPGWPLLEEVQSHEAHVAKVRILTLTKHLPSQLKRLDC